MTQTSLDTRRPFTRADAIAAGISPKQLRGSLFRRIFRGVYVESRVAVTAPLRAKAAITLFDPSRSFLSHASAGRMYDVPLPTIPDEHVTVLHPDLRRRRPGIVCHVARNAEVAMCDGVQVSAPAQMFVELASLLTLVDLTVVGDNLVRTRRATLRRLREACRGSGLPHAGQAAVAAALVRERVDSPMETRLRLLIVLAGLPEPEVNLTLRDVEGEVIRRYDLSYPGSRLVIEYDGRHHVERVEQWESDLQRREAIDDDGWRMMVFVAADIYQRPELAVRRIHRALRARRVPGTPRTLSEAWRPHFPGR